MKAILATIIFSYVFVYIIGINLGFLFPGINSITGHFGPVYTGIIFLSALIVGCTIFIIERIEKLIKDKG
ncbi:hypothetical protein [Piscibacillus salipiscarius]|uniref:DUF3955 domain-containing protein n=1 Tax=Piscibacillus salipiscarius TaxID=299480 RepID=A0ABW5Q5Q3_9BACI